MLRAAGRHQGGQLLSADSVAAMTRNHVTQAQRAAATPFLDPAVGWGYGMAAPAPVEGEPPIPYGYGWNGGTGTVWTTDPRRDVSGILLTQRALTSPEPPALFVDFWVAAYGATVG
jgi:CubicO group peptidase (beta-lactamase class C family)